MEKYDVVIVGAGLAGLQCAKLLGARRLRVLLTDRKPSLSESIHTTGIFVRRTLEDFMLPADCLGPVVRHVTLYSPKRRALDLESPHEEFRVGDMRKLYERFLADAVNAGVAWRPAARYISCELGEDSSIIKFETQGHLKQVRARFIVGADGATSRVACDLGLDSNQEWVIGVEDVLRHVKLEGEPRFHCFLDPEIAPGYLAWLVHDGEEVHLGVGGYAARFSPVSALQKFRASVSNIIDLRDAQHVERRGGRIPVGGVLRRIACRRGLLTGDAAGAVSPLTAGGLDPCLRLSSFAAHVIAEYLETDDETALALYSGERIRARFTLRLWMREAIKRLQHPVLLEFVCAALRLAPLRRIPAHIFFGRGSFPDTVSSMPSPLNQCPNHQANPY